MFVFKAQLAPQRIPSCTANWKCLFIIRCYEVFKLLRFYSDWFIYFTGLCNCAWNVPHFTRISQYLRLSNSLVLKFVEFRCQLFQLSVYYHEKSHKFRQFISNDCAFVWILFDAQFHFGFEPSLLPKKQHFSSVFSCISNKCKWNAFSWADKKTN